MRFWLADAIKMNSFGHLVSYFNTWCFSILDSIEAVQSVPRKYANWLSWIGKWEWWQTPPLSMKTKLLILAEKCRQIRIWFHEIFHFCLKQRAACLLKFHLVFKIFQTEESQKSVKLQGRVSSHYNDLTFWVSLDVGNVEHLMSSARVWRALKVFRLIFTRHSVHTCYLISAPQALMNRIE